MYFVWNVTFGAEEREKIMGTGVPWHGRRGLDPGSDFFGWDFDLGERLDVDVGGVGQLFQVEGDVAATRDPQEVLVNQGRVHGLWPDKVNITFYAMDSNGIIYSPSFPFPSGRDNVIHLAWETWAITSRQICISSFHKWWIGRLVLSHSRLTLISKCTKLSTVYR